MVRVDTIWKVVVNLKLCQMGKGIEMIFWNQRFQTPTPAFIIYNKLNSNIFGPFPCDMESGGASETVLNEVGAYKRDFGTKGSQHLILSLVLTFKNCLVV